MSLEFRWFRVPPGRVKLPSKVSSHKLEIWTSLYKGVPVGVVFFDGAWRGLCPHAIGPLNARTFRNKRLAQAWCQEVFIDKNAEEAVDMLRSLDPDITKLMQR